MRNLFTVLILITFGATLSAVENGAPAPAFTLPSAGGEEVSLAEHRGGYVVLEWINFDCPFVKKHYRSQNMSALQERYGEVTWLSINSSAPGRSGAYTGDELQTKIEEFAWQGDAYLLDADGSVGKAYGARTTPHIFIIDPDGRVIYQGGIDSIKSADVDDIAGATNYVRTALDAVRTGEAVPTPVSEPYGCSVKYAK